MVFKVDFEKTYVSISREYLFTLMRFMRFGGRWIDWIGGCLTSSFSLIIVNGSPTNEFQLHGCLRQGDPISACLFI